MQVGDRAAACTSSCRRWPAALDDYVGQEVIAGIRAEAISLARDGMVAGPAQRFVDARVEVIEPTGADTLIVINLGGHEFTVRLDPDVSLDAGAGGALPGRPEQARLLRREDGDADRVTGHGAGRRMTW